MGVVILCFLLMNQKNSRLDENNYWRVPYQGLKYFTVKGQVDELQDDYVVNGVPLVEKDTKKNRITLHKTLHKEV